MGHGVQDLGAVLLQSGMKAAAISCLQERKSQQRWKPTLSLFLSFFLVFLSLSVAVVLALSLSLPDSLPPYFWVRTVTADKHAVFQGILDIFLREVPLSSLQMMKTLGCILRLPRFLGSDCMCLLGRGGHSSIADVILEAKTP